MSWFDDLTSGIGGVLSGINPFGGSEVFKPQKLFNRLTGKESSDLASAQYALEKEYAEKNYAEQVRQYDLNYAQQLEAYNYQKSLNAMQMEREDTAVQRRVADLEAAGLSPTLAAGSAAGSTPVHAANVPQHDVPVRVAPSDVKVRQAMFAESMLKDRLSLALSAMGNFADVSRTKAETEFIRAKTGEQDVVNRYVESMLKERISGQQIANESGRIANSFAELSNPVKIDLFRRQLNVLDGHIRQLDLDNELKYNETLRKVYYDSMAKFGAQLAEDNVNIAKLRAENIDFDTALKAYSLTYSVEHGIPLHGLNDWQVIYQVVKEFKDLFGKHKKGENPLPKPGGFVPTTKKDWDNYTTDLITGTYTNPF